MYKVVGFKPYMFQDQQTGRTISGCRLFLTSSDEEEGVHGESVATISLSSEKLERCNYNPFVGDNVDIKWSRTRAGKADGIRPILDNP